MGPAAGRRAETICIAASPGGHIAELLAARAAFEPYRRVWVTGPSRQVDELRESGEDVHVLPSWGRDAPGLRGFLPNLRGARPLVARYRPAAVVTNGAGLVVPFALLARATGSGLVVIETMARVTRWSLTGRILAPVAQVAIVQWPELRRSNPTAVLARPALLEHDPPGDAAAGAGTFASVGTRPEPFDRLLAMVDRAVAADVLPRPVFAQSGTSTYRPATYSTVAWQRPGEVEAAIAGARYVVCHGGSGLIAAAIAAGRRPLVLARRKDRGEHRTEHQQQIVDRLAGDGLVVPLDSEIGAGEVRLADEPPARRPAAEATPSLEAVLGERLVALLGR